MTTQHNDESAVTIYDLDYEILETDIPFPLPTKVILLLNSLMIKYPTASESILAKHLKTEIQNTLNKDFLAIKDEIYAYESVNTGSESGTNGASNEKTSNTSLGGIDTKFCWHVIVGKEFGCFGTCEIGTYLHFRLNSIFCCIWAHA